LSGMLASSPIVCRGMFARSAEIPEKIVAYVGLVLHVISGTCEHDPSIQHLLSSVDYGPANDSTMQDRYSARGSVQRELPTGPPFPPSMRKYSTT